MKQKMKVFSLILVAGLSGCAATGGPAGEATRDPTRSAIAITNTQLGDVFAVYGVMAMLAYFPGGALADRFSADCLPTVSDLAEWQCSPAAAWR